MSTTYLADPTAFPARTEGVPWGAEEARFEAAGIPFRVPGLSALQRDTIEGLFPGPCPRAPRVDISLFRVEGSVFRSIDTRGWNYSLDFDYGPNHTHLVGMDWMAPRVISAIWALAGMARPTTALIQSGKGM